VRSSRFIHHWLWGKKDDTGTSKDFDVFKRDAIKLTSDAQAETAAKSLVAERNALFVAKQSLIRLLSATTTTNTFLPVHFHEPRLIFQLSIAD
jgi:hypothetical protein